jgi:hypothetical protein
MCFSCQAVLLLKLSFSAIPALGLDFRVRLTKRILAGIPGVFFATTPAAFL